MPVTPRMGAVRKRPQGLNIYGRYTAIHTGVKVANQAGHILGLIWSESQILYLNSFVAQASLQDLLPPFPAHHLWLSKEEIHRSGTTCSLRISCNLEGLSAISAEYQSLSDQCSPHPLHVYGPFCPLPCWTCFALALSRKVGFLAAAEKKCLLLAIWQARFRKVSPIVYTERLGYLQQTLNLVV